MDSFCISISTLKSKQTLFFAPNENDIRVSNAYIHYKCVYKLLGFKFTNPTLYIYKKLLLLIPYTFYGHIFKTMLTG